MTEFLITFASIYKQCIMTLVIVTILLLCYALIATENITNINKAAVAIFAGTVGWVLYICYGTDFVMLRHAAEYSSFWDGVTETSIAVKEFIAQNIFIKYVGRASSLVLFLLATMEIVEILNNNGCFDFISQLMKTRSSNKLLWIVSILTFLISANLDNLTTIILMLTIMHKIIPNRRLRMMYGAAILLSANFGGALTVIGDVNGLYLWTNGNVSASNYSLSMALPVLIAWLVPILWLGMQMPDRIETESITMPYRGDDTRLNVWQRIIMLFVGIGGLWFIPTFHDITKLDPFLGALCVLAVLWVVNEIINRKLLRADDTTTISNRIPRVLQYGTIQMALFVLGMMLAIGVIQEIGVIEQLSVVFDENVHNIWIVGVLAGAMSCVLDNFTTAISFFYLHGNVDLNGEYWKIIAYCTIVGGNVLCIGSAGGLALMRAERIHVGWYLRNVGLKVVVGGLLGFITLYFVA